MGRSRARVADALDAGVGGEAPGELKRALRLPANAEVERLQAAEEEPGGVGRSDRAGLPANLLQRVEPLAVADDEGAEKRVVVAGEKLGRAVQDDVCPVVERPKEHRRRGRRVDHHRSWMRPRRLEVGKR